MTNHTVIVAGGGPTGLMLAGELALAGVDVASVERRASQDLMGARAGGLHARTREIFDQRGIVDRFVAEGQKVQNAGFAGVKLDISGLPTPHPYGLGLWQMHTERILLGWVEEHGVPIYRGLEVTGFAQDGNGVSVELSDGRKMRADFLVGCDGGRSRVRKAAGIAFVGTEPTTSNIIAQAEFTGAPPLGVHRTALGIHSFGRTDYRIVDGQIVYADTGPYGVLVTEAAVGAGGDPTVEELRAALIAACGTDHGMQTPTYISRFTDATRQAVTYRQGRVLLAGDAAHTHPPDGGQGLQLGVQDAVNLGWKLAQAIKGTSSETLLDTYQVERHPVAARVLRHTLAAVALRRDDHHTRALRETFAELLAVPEAATYFAAEMSELGIRYDLGGGHPLVGRRMPDRDLWSGSVRWRTYSLLNNAEPLFIDFGGGLDIAGWTGRVRRIDATSDGPWELPAVGTVPAPSAVLVRPDGYVAWVGEGTDAGLAEALTRGFGLPAA